jgi:hypothetical protein
MHSLFRSKSVVGEIDSKFVGLPQHELDQMFQSQTNAEKLQHNMTLLQEQLQELAEFKAKVATTLL